MGTTIVYNTDTSCVIVVCTTVLYMIYILLGRYDMLIYMCI